MEQGKSRRKRPHQHHFDDLGIYIFESRHSPDFKMEMGVWDFHKVYAVRDGQGFLETDSASIPNRPNEIFYAPAHLPHRLVDDPADPLTVVVLCFYDKVFGDCSVAVDGWTHFRQNFPAASPVRLADNYARVQLRNRLKAIFVEQVQKKEGSRAVILSQLIELLVFLTRTHTEQRELTSADDSTVAFTGSLHYIEDNFFRPVKVEELASLANMSYRNFTEQFKRRTGKTVTQYLAERRVEYAKRIMLESDDILFASVEAGFGDLAHFYRVFKKITGQTPKQFIDSRKQPLQTSQAA